MTLVLAALLVACTSAFVARRPRALAAGVALAAAALALGVAVWQRRAWEFEVRRVAWVADATRGRWLDAGFEWLVSAAALAVASALASRVDRAASRGAAVGATLVALASAAALWGARP